jgi:hypothetical protein
VIFFLYRFEPAIAWSDAPFSWHLAPVQERVLPAPLPSHEALALLSVVLVDGDKSIVRGLRAVTFSPEFTLVLHTAITEKAKGRWDPAEFDAQLRLAYEAWPTTEQMLSRAIVRIKGGA